ncbi:1-phosphatidylinositol 4,5-bisphosphate phosphodiesterase zeta-1-like [Scyliorhinus canicula]|uniref:1-phosphatidylinositol 4,5-bisphosphate phosphodiesterase zeta-1-like n=1 Tax=Scyliorhinus canicula TaxID=7830 RepID=UPI0018F576B2|nr:1-phosphatidylinositol 4,5-bisphosphate phosphodiesterase zeta-1-like [Scyliorhinus canicula]
MQVFQYPSSMSEVQKEDEWLLRTIEYDFKNGKIDLMRTMALLHKLDIPTINVCSEVHLEVIDKVKLRMFGAEDFLYMYKVFTKRREPRELFKQYSSDGINMTTTDLLYFLKTDQHVSSADEHTASTIINSYEPVMRSKRKRKLMTSNGFFKFLTSKDCSIFNQDHTKVYQCMDFPMVNYFIASSQDTCFTGNQLIEQSNINGYISALRNGCRCLELDCWDGPENEPRLYHGFALTSTILVKEVIEVINMHAFEVSEYPLILSLEINCNPVQQRVIANYLVNILEDKLINMSHVYDDPTQLASPEELKYKILIRCKNIRKFSYSVPGMWQLVDGEAGENSGGYDPEAESEVKSVVPTGIRAFRMKKKTMVRLALEFSNVIVFTKSVDFKDFRHSLYHQLFYESNTFSEHGAMKLVKQSASEFAVHNSKFLSRTYSAGARRNFSNYKPHEFWNVGCQMVALNYEVPGLGMDLNRGKFQDNGGCGYVLKPKFMNNNIKLDTVVSDQNVDPTIIVIQIISGQHLPICRTPSKITIDVCVRVEIYGASRDCAAQQTKIVESAGCYPNWNDCLLFCVQVPELALIRFIVKDVNPFSENELLGQYTLPFTSMEKGYRVVPLLSSNGSSLSPTTLFVYVWYA